MPGVSDSTADAQPDGELRSALGDVEMTFSQTTTQAPTRPARRNQSPGREDACIRQSREGRGEGRGRGRQRLPGPDPPSRP